MSLSLITPTGGRPLAFTLCQEWMATQTYDGPVEWVIVDDGPEPTPITFARDGWKVEVVRPRPFWHPGQNTQSRNILVGLERATHDAVLIIEDDDFYGPRYVGEMVERFHDADLVGESRARYYNLKNRTWHEHRNDSHASLCQTGVQGTARLALAEACAKRPRFIDLALWQMHPGKLDETHHAVGIKGLPGRPGIGKGHGMRGKPDAAGDVLRSWVGVDAAERYLGLPRGG